MDLPGFADPWEHLRLLSDAPRNEALVRLLERRAPGARVLEVGCGTGLLSCLAARLGATRVYAVEPTPLWETAQALVEANGLADRVEVLPAMLEDLEPRPVDLAFAELLNADPFAEDVSQVMALAGAWAERPGVLAPRRLRLWLGLVRDTSSAQEVRDAQAQLRGLSQRFGLELGPLQEALAQAGDYRFISPRVELASKPTLLFDADLREGRLPPEAQTLALEVLEPGPVGGAALWFEAELDEGLSLQNAPGHPGHWGHLVFGWPQVQGATPKRPFPVEVCFDEEDGFSVMPMNAD
ncbi:MAG: 50S ribosomal protein L11 methyltransferase [Alphaproteobacteria bacterium]|nr:50S ribosomal protein L11 methyltransferase [Alphaproteobacteria bacterium]MCB9794933.1 50S ribosomal protein L11 methyltransferase [Alphaproteobacteria bacterium]